MTFWGLVDKHFFGFCICVGAVVVTIDSMWANWCKVRVRCAAAKAGKPVPSDVDAEKR